MNNQKNLAVLSTLIKSLPEKTAASYLKFLPDSVALVIQSDKTKKGKLKDISLKELFGKIDKSWYIEEFQKKSKDDLYFYISLFPEKTQLILASDFNLEPPFYSFLQPFEEYCLNLLFKELFVDELPLPLSFLPDFPLAFLMEYTSDHVDKLCFYLGLFDLTSELKSVIQGVLLTEIEKTLAPDEINFCKQIATYQNSLVFNQIGLARWNLDKELLRSVIYDRGLYRLSIALCDASVDMIWYVLHLLNKKNALKLEKLPKTNIEPKAILIVNEQIQLAWMKLCTVLK